MTRSGYYTCYHCGGEMICNVGAKTYDDKFRYTCEACGHSRHMLAWEDFERARLEVLKQYEAAAD